jgi:hypothetical protein
LKVICITLQLNLNCAVGDSLTTNIHLAHP